MNPLTKVKLINELNEREASLGVKETVSWHSEYKDSAWIFIGGFPYELTEGDIVCVFSQYGEIANINLVRDKKTGKSKGFCFICYEDQRSTILAVDNLNGIKIKGRTIRVDHVLNYRPPKDNEDMDDITKRLREEGCAPKLPDHSSSESEEEEQYAVPVKKPKKDKKEKKKKKKEKKALKAEREQRERLAQTPPGPVPTVRVKQEKEDLGYDRYSQRGVAEERLRSRGERPGPGAELRNPRDTHRQEDGGFRNRYGDQQDRERDRSREDEKRRHEMGERRDGGLQLESKRTGREEGERTRERERDNDRNRESEKDSDRNRDREREKDRDSDRNRDREREKDSDRNRDREREKDRDSDRNRERDQSSKHREEHSREREYRRK
ncbi:RNA-binding motif protein, X-linked 2-like [Oncorhynchus nerka]|uniref:RNA-binding motif protein, X-linked 2-like n=1 Tax=Oncorhynchus nerka TaxID=8023 RepID=UPI0011306420|nr:RNA-binding motif protein, X-linked 2-like [Oncorhynchus nerka]